MVRTCLHLRLYLSNFISSDIWCIVNSRFKDICCVLNLSQKGMRIDMIIEMLSKQPKEQEALRDIHMKLKRILDYLMRINQNISGALSTAAFAVLKVLAVCEISNLSLNDLLLSAFFTTGVLLDRYTWLTALYASIRILPPRQLALNVKCAERQLNQENTVKIRC